MLCKRLAETVVGPYTEGEDIVCSLWKQRGAYSSDRSSALSKYKGIRQRLGAGKVFSIETSWYAVKTLAA